jgi:aryl-alcohol dehydrogenase-like predicted oxidoreductase
MQYTNLGNTGTIVSRVSLGTMTFGTDVSSTQPIGGIDHAAADQILGRAMDAGINLIDTADVYGAGASEALLGDVLGPRRDAFVLATKFSGRTGPGLNQAGQSRLHLHRALDASLRRLRTDHIDLYQVHNFDPITPMEETLRALDDVVRAGKARYVGCSNYAGWQLAKALGLSAREGLARFATIQSYYSLVGRDVEHEVLPAARDAGVGMLCWSPLAGGLLSGKVDRHASSPSDTRRSRVSFPPVDEAVAFDAIDVIKAIAAVRSVSPPAVAIAWLLSRPGVTSVVCGASKVDHLHAGIDASLLVLSDDELARLDAVTRPAASYPGWIQTYRAALRVPEGFPGERASWAPGEAPVDPLL